MLNLSIQYGDHVVDFAKVPEVSVKALLQRGVAHLLGNEQAAKVSAAKKKGEEANTPMSEDAIAELKSRLTSEALADIYAGEIGSGRGPSIDPVERELRSLIDAHIANNLAGAGIKFGKGRKLPTDDEIVTFANNQTRTLEQMRENTRKLHGERFKKEAEKRVADLAKKAANAKAQAEALAKAGPVDAESLGL